MRPPGKAGLQGGSEVNTAHGHAKDRGTRKPQHRAGQSLREDPSFTTVPSPKPQHGAGSPPTGTQSPAGTSGNSQHWALCCAIQEAALGAGGESRGLSDQVPCQEVQLR